MKAIWGANIAGTQGLYDSYCLYTMMKTFETSCQRALSIHWHHHSHTSMRAISLRLLKQRRSVLGISSKGMTDNKQCCMVNRKRLACNSSVAKQLLQAERAVGITYSVSSLEGSPGEHPERAVICKCADCQVSAKWSTDTLPAYKRGSCCMLNP
jgi:hypothetical protein